MKKNFFCSKTELLNFELALLLAKLDMIGARQGSNVSIYSSDISVDI